MNNPLSVCFDGDVVVGVTDKPFPEGSVFRIPLDTPEEFTVERGESTG